MYSHPKQYDVIVIGGGHAGIEASLAAAKMGCSTLLLTANPDSIGQMSCNPAIGGIGKGHLVREIDALGGVMGIATDLTGIQFRMLNTKKGPAVWSPRAQCDKREYQHRLKLICESQPALDVKQGHATGIVCDGTHAVGVDTMLGVRFAGKTLVVTTGTFLHALLHYGDRTQPGGRAGEHVADGLSASLLRLGIELGRLKTGTPPRLNKHSINLSRMEAQFGDTPVPFLSFWTDDLFHMEQNTCHDTPMRSDDRRFPGGSLLRAIGGQMACFMTRTTDRTREIITRNIDRSPLYSGSISGIGPRYCPSIEDKIIKFRDKKTHQIFIEPEGISTAEYYVNGLSTSMPYDIQIDIVRSVIGCENAEIVRTGYAVEYDYSFPTQLWNSLESKLCRNLYLAGQINGTSGYEEAAAQGLMAGINAARRCKKLDPIVLRRDQAYVGVLIDDLVTKGTTEPYRMFTSRAEHRLLLRQDNADFRLSEIGHEIGLLSSRNLLRFKTKKDAVSGELRRLHATRHGSQTLAQLLRRPEIAYRDLPSRDDSLPIEVIQQVEIGLKYEGYLKRQHAEVEKLKSLDHKQIPASFDFSSVPNLRLEARQKLSDIRPTTIGQASRISGVSPADVSNLVISLRRQSPSPATLATGKGPVSYGTATEDEDDVD